MASREAGMAGMAGVRNTIYNIFIRRTSVYTTTCVIAGIVGTKIFFNASDSVWKSLNKGKSWEEVLPTLPPKEEDDD